MCFDVIDAFRTKSVVKRRRLFKVYVCVCVCLCALARACVDTKNHELRRSNHSEHKFYRRCSRKFEYENALGTHR